MSKEIYKDLNMNINHILAMNLKNNSTLEDITSNSLNILIQNNKELKVYNIEDEMISHTLGKNNLPVCLESEFFLRKEGKKMIKFKFKKEDEDEKKEEDDKKKEEEEDDDSDEEEPEIMEVEFDNNIIEIFNDSDRFYVLTENNNVEILDYQLHKLTQVKFPVQFKNLKVGNDIFYHKNQKNNIEVYNDDGKLIKTLGKYEFFVPYANLLIVYESNESSIFLLDSTDDFKIVDQIKINEIIQLNIYECYLFYLSKDHVLNCVNISDNLKPMDFNLKINGELILNKAHIIDHHNNKLDIYAINLKVQENIREYFENEEIRNLILTLKNNVKNLYLDYNYEKNNQISIKNQIYDLRWLLKNFKKQNVANENQLKKKIEDKKNGN